MKKLTIVMLAACAAALTGCKSIEVERHGQKLATVQDANGNYVAVTDKDGKPVVLDGGWEVDYFQHWNWQKFDEMHATAGAGVALDINKYEGGADASNLVALVGTSLDGLTKLAVAVGEAYEKIAGGGAQASTALKTSASIINYFRDKGGDVNKATVTTDAAAKTIKVTDGATTIECDSAGNCVDRTN